MDCEQRRRIERVAFEPGLHLRHIAEGDIGGLTGSVGGGRHGLSGDRAKSLTAQRGALVKQMKDALDAANRHGGQLIAEGRNLLNAAQALAGSAGL